MDDILAQLRIDQVAEILGNDDITVAVADDYPIAVWQAGASDAELFFAWDMRNEKAAEMKENFDVSAGFEFAQEFFINCGDHIASFVEED